MIRIENCLIVGEPELDTEGKEDKDVLVSIRDNWITPDYFEAMKYLWNRMPLRKKIELVTGI